MTCYFSDSSAAYIDRLYSQRQVCSAILKKWGLLRDFRKLSQWQVCQCPGDWKCQGLWWGYKQGTIYMISIKTQGATTWWKAMILVNWKKNHKTSFIRSAGGLVLYVTFRPQKHYCSVLLLHKILMIFMNFVSKISHWKIFSIWRPWWKRDWHRECVGRGNKYRK